MYESTACASAGIPGSEVYWRQIGMQQAVPGWASCSAHWPMNVRTFQPEVVTSLVESNRRTTARTKTAPWTKPLAEFRVAAEKLRRRGPVNRRLGRYEPGSVAIDYEVNSRAAA